MNAGIERARQAKAELAARAQTHTCGECGATAVTYVPCEVWHWCPATSPARLVEFLRDVSRKAV